jgi:branched-chain amino acid transport system substrate-binding protein
VKAERGLYSREIAMRIVGLMASALVVLAATPAASPARAEVRIGLAAPLTGPMAWAGAATEQSAEFAVADLNAKGGVLSEQIELITADDYCDGEQAVAAANKLVAAGVVAVFGHQCSGAAIPASKIYADAGVLMISTFATNPKLTEQGLKSVFRVVGRDDLQGRIAGDLLAERWGHEGIAVLHDGQAYGKGLAEETKNRLNERGIAEAMFEAIEPGKADYWDIIQKMQAMGVEVLYFGGYPHEGGLLIRQAREHGYELQLVAGDGISNEDFGLIAGPASDGTLMSNAPQPVDPEARALLERLTPDVGAGADLKPYAALQVWVQAVEQAGTFETEAVAEALRTYEFDTVFGRIGFDEKGDVTGHETFVWYIWKDGKYSPAEPGKLTE